MILTAQPEIALKRLKERVQSIHPTIDTSTYTSLEELLQAVPVISKTTIKTFLPSQDIILSKALLFSETSGTTGNPLPTPRCSEDLRWNMFNQAIAYKRFINPGIDRVAVLHPSILSPFVEASVAALQNLNIGYVRIYPIPHVCDYNRIFDILERYQITTIMSTPSLVYKLFFEFYKLHQKVPRFLYKLLLTGEHIGAACISNLKRLLNNKDSIVAPFVYGSSEAATLMIGREDGIFEPILDDFIFELVDTEYTNYKRLIVTWLREGLMPIVRYDTNDLFVAEEKDFKTYLNFIGRYAKHPLSFYTLLSDIERIIYSSCIPIFHYQGTYSLEKKELNLSVVTSPEYAKTLYLSTIYNWFSDWNVHIDINPPNIKFFQFSPLTKTTRLLPC